MNILVFSNILLWALLFAALAFAYRRLSRAHNVLFFWKSAPKGNETIDGDSLDKAVHFALHSLDVNYRHEEQDERYIFHLDYQNGRFMIIVPCEKPDHLRFLFPVIASTEIDHISLARTLCNEINCHSILVTALYDVDTTEDCVRINLTFSIPATNDSGVIAANFSRIAGECFFIQRHAATRLNDLTQKAERLDTNDVEYNSFRDDSLNFILLESEHDYDFARYSLDPSAEGAGRPMTVGRLIESEAFAPINDLVSLEVKGSSLDLTLTDAAEIKAYPLDAALTDDREHPRLFVRDDARLTLRYQTYNEAGTIPTDRSLLLHLRTERISPEALYYRLTFLIPDRLKTEYIDESNTEGKKTPVSGSLVLARDLKDENKYRAEFRYVWGEMLDKVAGGREGDLNDREELLYRAKSPDDGYLLFRAHRMMRQHRFTEALDYLERLWHIANRPDLLMVKDYSERMDYVAYLKGTCHLKLGEYEKAFFYLRMISHKGVIAYYRQYLNCMIACGHPYAFEEVESALKQTDEKIEEMKGRGMDVPEEVASFRRFLNRRLVFIHIDLHHFKTAEESLRRLMEEPENMDFALQQLARIEELKKRNAPNDNRVN